MGRTGVKDAADHPIPETSHASQIESLDFGAEYQATTKPHPQPQQATPIYGGYNEEKEEEGGATCVS